MDQQIGIRDEGRTRNKDYSKNYRALGIVMEE